MVCSLTVIQLVLQSEHQTKVKRSSRCVETMTYETVLEYFSAYAYLPKWTSNMSQLVVRTKTEKNIRANNGRRKMSSDQTSEKLVYDSVIHHDADCWSYTLSHTFWRAEFKWPEFSGRKGSEYSDIFESSESMLLRNTEIYSEYSSKIEANVCLPPEIRNSHHLPSSHFTSSIQCDIQSHDER